MVPGSVDRIRIHSAQRRPYFSLASPVWYLGERVAVLHSTAEFVTPADPPESMINGEKLRELIGERGLDALVSACIPLLLPGVPYGTHVARLARPPKLDAEQVFSFL